MSVEKLKAAIRDVPDFPKPGIIFSGNVYYGAPDELRDKACYLWVLNIEHKK